MERGGAVRVWVVYPHLRMSLGRELKDDFELLESLFVELDPLTASFSGAVVEIYSQGDSVEGRFAEPVTCVRGYLSPYSRGWDRSVRDRARPSLAPFEYRSIETGHFAATREAVCPAS